MVAALFVSNSFQILHTSLHTFSFSFSPHSILFGNQYKGIVLAISNLFSIYFLIKGSFSVCYSSFTWYSVKTVVCEITLSLIQTTMGFNLFLTFSSRLSFFFKLWTFLSHHNIYDSHPKPCHQIQQHRQQPRPNFRWDFHQHFHNVRMKSQLIQRCSCLEATTCARTTKQSCIQEGMSTQL
jgi:hypothetical protein